MTVLMIVAIDELMLSVRTESPYKTIEEFVAAAQARPGQLTIGGTGTHNEDHIFAHLFEQAAKIKLKYVPFNSGGEVTAALMGGHIDAGVMNPNEIVAQVEAGKAKNLAVAAHKRMTGAADVPTFAETGIKGMDGGWTAVVVPSRTPHETVMRLNREFRQVLDSPPLKASYLAIGLTVVASSPEELAKRISEETPKWRDVIKRAGITPG
jgi:tripartite-type tricarboxylate transporter receptor subunit TctC